MKIFRLILTLLILIINGSCIRNYVPSVSDYDEVLVVEGFITDQPEVNTIKISKSQPLWKRLYPKPLTGCIVTISDDQGQIYTLKEMTTFGVYITDPAIFRGIIGREYTLHIQTTTETPNLSYESLPMKMIPVPPIDSIYYEKKIFEHSAPHVEGCNIYLNTHDPSNTCRFFRWEYSETWEFHLPFNSANKICWISNYPKQIIIKNASLISDASVIRFPVNSIKDPIDRLSVKYSILVNQFSLNEDEYLYWDRLKNTVDQTGGLYDLIPAVIPNNIYCIEEPFKKVLGFFSVSAMSSKRLFIKDKFAGINTMYERCLTDTLVTNRLDTVAGLGQTLWIIFDNSNKVPPANIYTTDMGCVDCRIRGTNIKPVFWDDDK